MPQPGNGLRLLIILVTNKCWNVCLQQSVWKGMQILLYIFFILVRLQWQHSPALRCCAFQPPCRDTWLGCVRTSKATPALGAEINPTIPVEPGAPSLTSPMFTLPGIFPCCLSLATCFGFSWTNRGEGWIGNGFQEPLEVSRSWTGPRLWPGIAGSALGREQTKDGTSSPLFHRGMPNVPVSKLHIQWKHLPLGVTPCSFF